MTTVTLTAPDGHRERWDFNTTYLALLSWYSYLKDENKGTDPTGLAKSISEFVGDDINQVHTFLVYLDGIKGNLYSKLSMLMDENDIEPTRLYFIMKSINNPNYLPHNKQAERERQKIIDRINEVTNNDKKTLNRLIEITKLFVDGQLSYKHMEVYK